MSDLTPLEAGKILLPCNLEQLNERILNLGIGIAQMGEQDSIRVHKSFLVSVLGYMEELLAVRNKIAAGEYKQAVHGRWIKQDCQGDYGLCSECGCRIPWIPKNYQYCPRCGALMDGKDDRHETN